MTPVAAWGWGLLGLALAAPALAVEDDWLGVYDAPDVALQLWGGGSEDSEGFGIDAAFALGVAQLFVGAGQTRTVGDDATLQDDRRSLGFGSDPTARGSVRLDLLFHGEEDAAEFTEFWLTLGGYSGAWDATLRAMDGTAELFLREGLRLPRSGRRSVEVTAQAFGGSVGYLIGSMRLGVDYTRYWYSDDLGLIAERPLLELALGPVTVGHSASLPEAEGGGGVSLARGPWNLGMYYRQSRSALDGEWLESALLSVARRLDDHLGVGGRATLPLDGGATYGELVLDVAF